MNLFCIPLFLIKKMKKIKRLNRDSQGLRTPRDRIKRIFTTIFLVK